MKLIRRAFLKSIGVFSAGFYTSRLEAIAGPFVAEDFADGAPPDKKLNPEWVKDILRRGTKTVYTKANKELRFIGMPVGGIGTGTLYLGGDGRLWLWDIFNDNREGVDPKEILFDGKKIKSRDGSAYVEPPVQQSKLQIEQGFGIRIGEGKRAIIKHLKDSDWAQVTFKGEYPVATVNYKDTALPVEVTMEAFSPFIPLDSKNSGLPAVLFSFTIKNISEHKVSLAFSGWLQNACSLFSGDIDGGKRINEAVKTELFTGVRSYFQKTNAAKGSDKPQTKADEGFMTIASLIPITPLDRRSKTTRAAKTFTDFDPVTLTSISLAKKGLNPKIMVGGVTETAEIDAGGSAQFLFAIAWFFPNIKVGIDDDKSGRYYSAAFSDSTTVIEHLSKNKNYLISNTRRWRDTWYDSSLPYWFLDRTFGNISTLATSTCHRFGTGRFWAWEGVGCCKGTCTHVWQYAQAVGRIFPDLERDTRERVDLGISLDKQSGMIRFRGEGSGAAIDGQAGTILRIYREHQMSVDGRFLEKNWFNIKSAVEYIISQDKNKDGMLDTPIENTLDAVWDGEIAWLVGLCIAAVKAGETMAKEMNDESFASICRAYVEKGKSNMETHLFNGEYFIHRPDPIAGRKKLGSYNTCHIDQVFGQSWAFQVGLGRILDREKTVSALRALWKYNFMPDVSRYTATHKGGRPYALAGEGGMVMNTNPKNEEKPYGENVTWQGGYFHECMSGFEHQVASHMIAEGMVEEGMILTRVIEDRYHAAKRNPYNEIECSDHYARAMASYGSFLTICGYEYHGPKGYIAFAPKLNADHFKAAFTSCEGWGNFVQTRTGKKQINTLELKFGRLRLTTIALNIEDNHVVSRVSTSVNRKLIATTISQQKSTIIISIDTECLLKADEELVVEISYNQFN